MGNKDSKKHENKNSETKLPEFNYLNRSEKFVLLFSNNEIEKVKFSENINFYQESAILEFTEKKFIIVGGKDANGTLMSDVYIIDMTICKVIKAAPIPFPCRLGNLLPYKDYIYYIGGLTTDSEAITEHKSSPLMRYSLTEQYWEAFVSKPFSFKAEIIKLSELILPGAFILSKYLYIFGGLVVKEEPKPNHMVLTIDLEKEKLKIRNQGIFFPYPLYQPLSTFGSKNPIIIGGKKPDGSPSSMYIAFDICIK